MYFIINTMQKYSNEVKRKFIYKNYNRLIYFGMDFTPMIL